MVSTEVESLCTELECYLQGWNSFYRVGMLPTGLEFILQGRNASYRVGTVSTGLACFRPS
jgi:hypothetical protein